MGENENLTINSVLKKLFHNIFTAFPQHFLLEPRASL